MRPIVGDMYLLGGSHAQQDVLEQLFLDPAMKADSAGDIRLMLERVSAGIRCRPAAASATPRRRRATRIEGAGNAPRQFDGCRDPLHRKSQ